MANPMYGSNSFDDRLDGVIGKALTVEASSDGSTGSPTTTLTNAEVGNTYFISIATYTYAFKLPSVSDVVAGAKFTFILNEASDGETSKDLIITCAAADEDIVGVGLDAGAVHDAATGNSTLTFDTSAGTASIGDRVTLICDGSNWYIMDCVCLSAGALVSG